MTSFVLNSFVKENRTIVNDKKRSRSAGYKIRGCHLLIYTEMDTKTENCSKNWKLLNIISRSTYRQVQYQGRYNSRF